MRTCERCGGQVLEDGFGYVGCLQCGNYLRVLSHESIAIHEHYRSMMGRRLTFCRVHKVHAV